MSEPITVATRTGRETHAASPGSSVTYCGRWLRVVASAMKIAEGTDAVTCRSCQRSLCPYCAPDEPCALHVRP